MRDTRCSSYQNWFHDIYRVDGTPYSEAEVAFIKQMTGVNAKP